MPFEGLLLNPYTKRQLELFIKQPSHALLISGPVGAGKKHIARHLSANLLGVDFEDISNHPYSIVLTKPADKSEISIDAARELIKKMSLKVPADPGGVNRIALVEDAGLLSHEAQNALLKLIEEPPAGSLIILTAVSAGDVLPTIASRLQKISVLPAGLDESQEFFGANYSPSEIASQWRLSQGAVGLLSALLSQAEDHPLRLAVNQAKKFLTLNKYNRLIYLQALAKNKSELGIFLEALARVLAALQAASSSRADPKKLLKCRELVHQTLNSISKNTNPRLLALNLALNMPL